MFVNKTMAIMFVNKTMALFVNKTMVMFVFDFFKSNFRWGWIFEHFWKI